MRIRGRANLLLVLGALCAMGVAALFFTKTESPMTVATEFMNALARGDVGRLTDLTHLGDDSREEIRKKWDYAVNVAGPYYRFVWRPLLSDQPDETNANVKILVVRNSTTFNGLEEPFGIPMVKDGSGRWKVDVRGIHREMFPGLPR